MQSVDKCIAHIWRTNVFTLYSFNQIEYLKNRFVEQECPQFLRFDVFNSMYVSMLFSIYHIRPLCRWSHGRIPS